MFISIMAAIIGLCIIIFHRCSMCLKDEGSEDVLHKGVIKYISFTSYPTYVNKDAYRILLHDGRYVTVHQTVRPPYETGDAVTVIERNGAYMFDCSSNRAERQIQTGD